MRSIRDFIAKNERDFDTLPASPEEPVGIAAQDVSLEVDGEPVLEESSISPVPKSVLSSFFAELKGKEALKSADAQAKRAMETAPSTENMDEVLEDEVELDLDDEDFGV